jgi:hypothetical protein
MEKVRSLWRYYVVGAAASVFIASIATCFLVVLHCEALRPRKPEPDRGFVYPMTGNGYTSYISAEDSADQALLAGIGTIAIVVALVTLPKDIFKRPNVSAGQSRLVALGKAQEANERAIRDFLTSNPSIGIFAFLVLVIYFATIYFVGALIARLGASYGLGFWR